ncbi:unnamed protein product [Caenorhabditis angaria]|uniref:Uncharacterized protein n=1 Tax=Caenorhabditis angaria TaxID=860376 RepID=A0A9P1N1A5_9PELO|nr:unnamed protein product [Caenorhabditis angaria]
MSKTSRIDETNFEINRRRNVKPHFEPNHIYITRKTNIEQQSKKAAEMLNNSFDEIFIHGMGASLNKAMVFALEVERKFAGSVKSDVLTSTVQVTDEIFSFSDEHENNLRNRPISAVHIHLYRVIV